MFDSIKSEKQKAQARYNLLRRIVRLRQFLELLVVCGVLAWSSARVPDVFKLARVSIAKLYGFVFNHHVVFVIGNAIIVLLYVLCRQSDGGGGDDGDGERDFYDDYVKHSVSISRREAKTEISDSDDVVKSVSRGDDVPTAFAGFDDVAATSISLCSGAEETIYHYDDVATAVSKSGAETAISRRHESEKAITRYDDVSPCDEVAVAIEKASRQIKRFERTQSERLRRAIAPSRRRSVELRRSETEINRKTPPAAAVAEIERLDSEEFRRAIDAFIDKHWNKKGAKQSSSEFGGEYQLESYVITLHGCPVQLNK